jgi:hypothetical protein
MCLLFIHPNGNVVQLPLIVRICLMRVIGLEGLFQREAIFLWNVAKRYGCVWLIGVLDVTGPADDQLLAGDFERADNRGVVSVTGGERPFGRGGGVAGFRERGGFDLWLNGVAINDDGFSRWGLGGTWEIALGCATGKGRYDGKVVAYMKAATWEFDTLGGEIGLLLEDVFANVLEGDLGRRKVLRETIHEDEGRGGDGERTDRRLESLINRFLRSQHRNRKVRMPCRWRRSAYEDLHICMVRK